MKIIDVRTILLTGPSTNDPFLREARKRRSAAFVEILTDGPLTGLGETYIGYFCPEVVPEVVAFFRPVLIGQGVEDVPELWRRMYHCGNYWCRLGLGAAVLSAIEAALWDLKGKLLGQPVCELLGGARHERLPAYATGGPCNYPKDRLARKIDHYLSLGFNGFKIGVGGFYPDRGFVIEGEPAAAADFEADKLAFVRSHAGPDVRVMIDGHMGNTPGKAWSTEVAIAVAKAAEPFNLFFFEEPLHYTNPTGYAELCRATPVPIAGGECLTTSCEWQSFVEQDCFDIGQPDGAFNGGLSETLRIAAMFAQRGRKIATHSWGSGGAFMQNLHAAFAAPNTCIMEIAPDYAGLHSEVIGDSFRMKDGCVLAPDKPGLGITLTEEVRRRYPFIPGSGEFNSVPGKVLTE